LANGADPRTASARHRHRPIGDRLTMGGAVAAVACRRYFNFDKAIPCHYGSFPIIDQTVEKFVEGLKGSSTEAVVPKIGKTIPV